MIALSQFISDHLPEFIAVLGYLLTFSFIPVVLLRKRQPSSAIAWCLTIIFLPYLGTFLFLIIGIPHVNRPLRKKQRQRSRFVKQWIETTADQPHYPQMPEKALPGKEWNNLDRLACIVGGVKVSESNEMKIYHEGTRLFEDKLQAIRNATQHIHAEYYILRADQAGHTFVELLCQKAKQGIEVRLLVDAYGSYEAWRLLHKLRASGGKACTFLPIMLWRRRFVLNLRNHRKILICDGKVAFTGGVNIGDEYLGRSEIFGFWRDTQLKIVGPAVLALQRVFVEDWDFAAQEFISGQKYFPKPVADGSSRLQIVWSGPDLSHNAIREIFFTVINQVQEQLWISTPYLVPDSALLNSLTNAALRGVEVHIITQGSPPDSWITYFAARYYWPELINAGVKIYRYEKGMLHAKIMIADRAWASVGSANLDVRSLRLNFEADCLIYSQKDIDELITQFEQDQKDAQLVTSDELTNQPLHIRLAENVSRLLTPIL
ncbi:MAG: Major cardiolipin synthase ClsA [Phycisphaerae bacterium]|nr:Major cardiolipin synthase ClsA [Phycisphaerae bacterium]